MRVAASRLRRCLSSSSLARQNAAATPPLDRRALLALPSSSGPRNNAGARRLVRFHSGASTPLRPPSCKTTWAQPAILVGIGSAAAGVLAVAATSWALSPSSVGLRRINEDIFNGTDNIFLFFFDREEELHERWDDIQTVIRTLLAEEKLRCLRFFYNVRSEEDAVPSDDKEPSSSELLMEEEREGQTQPLKCFMYKGQRKDILRVGNPLPIDDVIAFFQPRTHPVDEALQKFLVSHVSGDSFQREVVQASATHPILLQMFEETCFLCFLMRPFINSMAKLFKDHGISLQIKRLDIEKNDFPVGCPISRGTPTFVLFRGRWSAAAKWEEFRPSEIVDKLKKEFPRMPEEVVRELSQLQETVSRRFQLFVQIVMWAVEVQRLQKTLISSSPISDSPNDSDFNSVVADMMSQDMNRLDSVPENMARLQEEADEMERDAAILGSMLAAKVHEQEQLEEQRARPAASRKPSEGRRWRLFAWISRRPPEKQF